MTEFIPARFSLPGISRPTSGLLTTLLVNSKQTSSDEGITLIRILLIK